MASFGCSFLLAWGKGAVELSVYEEIGQDSARAPWDSVGPPLDPRSRFFVHKDISAHDKLAPLPVMRSTEAVGQCTSEACLEDDQRVLGCFNVPSPCWHTCRSFANIHSSLDGGTGGSNGNLLLARKMAKV